MTKSLSVIFFLSLLLGGCASTTPVNGALYSDIRGPVAATHLPKGNLKGESCATSYLGLVALGDASIGAAAEKAGITNIVHVDQHSTNILGLIHTYCTEVSGHKKKK
jgi:hypothetical protein